MIKAARKAARSLIRDFNEVEKLQVVSKSAGDFVSKADIRAETIIKDELLRYTFSHHVVGLAYIGEPHFYEL